MEVVAAKGRIESVRVVKERDNREIHAFRDVPKRIVEKQGLADVDTVTGATMPSGAVLNAAVNAPPPPKP